MKKKLIYVTLARNMKQMLRIMKVMTLLLFVLCIQVSASTYGQMVRFNFSMKNSTFKQVIEQIEGQSGYRFVLKYDKSILDKRFDVKYKNATIRVILDDMLRNSGLSYRIVDKYIAITETSEKTARYVGQQSRGVTGKVTSSSGEALAGVTVVAKGTTNGTITDKNGNYSLSGLKGNEILSFSFVGMKTKEVPLSGKSFINIAMTEEAIGLNEIVAIGYGTVKKRDLTGSVQSVKIDGTALAQLPNINPMLTIAESVAGVDYSPLSSAGEDATSSMLIRGANSISASNKPLIVVDGSIFTGSINEINTDDVASVDVLKDASAAAIYGSRSANGVILITTKRGKTGKPQISFSSYYGIQSWTRKPKMVNNADALVKRRISALEEISGLQDVTIDKALSATELKAYKEGVWTDWIDEITQVAPIQNYTLSVSGNTDRNNYYISAGYMNQKGILVNDNFKRFNIMTKLENKVTDWLTVGIKGNYYSADYSGTTPRLQEATWMSPLSYTTVQTAGYESWPNRFPNGTSYPNPLWGNAATGAGATLWRDNTDTRGNIDGTGWAKVDFPIKGLSYKLNLYGYHSTQETDLFIRPQWYVDTNVTSQMDNPSQFLDKSSGQAYTLWVNGWIMDHLLTYNRTFGDHSIDALLGYTRESYDNNSMTMVGSGFKTAGTDILGIYGLSMATTQTINRLRSRYQNIGYLGRVNYNYKGKYYATASFRRDGFSGFAPDHKFGNFPSAAVGWNISQEEFMKPITWLNFLKLRLSYGKTGNQGISAYETLSKMGSSYTTFGGTNDVAGDSQKAQYPSSLSNTKLSWEKTITKDFGLNFSVLNQRLSGIIDLYVSNTSDQLLTRTLPIMTGYSTVETNVGEVQNKGIEVTLNSVNIEGRTRDELRWESGLIFSMNRNKLIHLYGTDANGDGIEDNDISGAPFYDVYVIGKSIHSIWDYKMLGIVQATDVDYINKYGAKPGDVKFEDYNKDGKITSADRHVIGNTDPLFTMILNNTVSYKGFSLYFSFRWNAGNDEYYLTSDRNGSWHGISPVTTENSIAAEPWTAENKSNKYPRISYTNPLGYSFVQQREFLKLKDITFSYDFNGSFLKSLKIERLRLYASGKDLFTATKWTGLDPETGAYIGGASPSFKTISFGANITF